MAKILVQIDVNDKGNVAIRKLIENTEKVQTVTAKTGDVLGKVFASSQMLKGVNLIVSGLKAMTDEVIKFDKAMKGIEAIGGISDKGMLGKFSKEARSMAKETEFSASAVATAMLELNKAGVTGADALKVMPDMLNLATTAQTELAWATTETMAVLRAFNLEVSEIDRVVNVVASGLNMSALDTENFMDAMRHVAPVAGKMNVSIEETTAMLAALSDAGIKGSLAGTSLKNILTNLLKPAPAVAKALREMGVNGKTLTEILAGLNDKGLNMLDFLETFDKRAVVGSTLLAQERKKLVELTTAFEEQKAKVADVARVYREAYELRLSNVKNLLNEVGLSLADAFGPRPTSLIEVAQNALKDLDTIVDNNRVRIGEFAEGLGSVLGLLGDLSGVVLPPVLKDFQDLFDIVGEAGDLTDSLTDLFDKFSEGKPEIEFARDAVEEFFKMFSPLGRLSEALKGLNTIMRQISGKGEPVSNLNKDALMDDDFIKRAKDALAANKTMKELEQSYKNLDDMKWNTKVDSFQGLKDLLKYTDDKQIGKDLVASQKAFRESFKFFEGTYSLKDLEAYVKQRKMIDELAAFGATPELPLQVPPKKNKGVKIGDPNATAKEWDSETEKYWQEQADKMLHGSSNLRLGAMGFWTDTSRNKMEANEKSGFIPGKALDEDKRLTDEINSLTEEMNNPWFERQEQIEQYGNMAVNIYSSSVDLIDSFEQAAHEKRMARFEAEANMLDRNKSRELALAGNNAFRRELIEEKYAQKKMALDAKIEAEREKQAKREKQRSAVLAIATAFLAALDAMAREKTGAIGKMLSFGLILGAGLSAAASIADLALRDGGEVNSRVFRGQGNGTSDSLNARVSAGEVVLSKRDTDSLGGPSGIAEMLDRGATYGSRSGNNTYIDTFVGQKSWVRDLMEMMEKEKKR